MKRFHSFPAFLTLLLSGVALPIIAHAETDDGYSVSAPSDLPPPTANDGDTTNDPPIATAPASTETLAETPRTDGTVDSSQVEKDNPETDLPGSDLNYGNSLANGTLQNDPVIAPNTANGNTSAQNRASSGQRTVTPPPAAIAVPSTGGAMGSGGTSAGSPSSGGAMGGSSGSSSAGASVGGGAFGH